MYYSSGGYQQGLIIPMKINIYSKKAKRPAAAPAIPTPYVAAPAVGTLVGDAVEDEPVGAAVDEVALPEPVGAGVVE